MVLFFSHLLRALPQPVLAAVVLVAVAGLFKLSALKHLWRANRAEFVVAMAALLGVLSSGLLRGVMIGAIISLVQLLRRASRPHVAFLGRIPGTRRFSDRERHPDNELIPGVLIFRPESGLIYFNVDHVRDTIADRVRAEATPPKLVVLDLSAAPRVDLQSAHTLGGLADELTAAGIRVQAVEARSSVRERLRAKAWTSNSAGSTGSPPSPTRWKNFKNRPGPEDSHESTHTRDDFHRNPLSVALRVGRHQRQPSGFHCRHRNTKAPNMKTYSLFLILSLSFAAFAAEQTAPPVYKGTAPAQPAATNQPATTQTKPAAAPAPPPAAPANAARRTWRSWSRPSRSIPTRSSRPSCRRRSIRWRLSRRRASWRTRTTSPNWTSSRGTKT